MEPRGVASSWRAEIELKLRPKIDFLLRFFVDESGLFSFDCGATDLGCARLACESAETKSSEEEWQISIPSSSTFGTC